MNDVPDHEMTRDELRGVLWVLAAIAALFLLCSCSGGGGVRPFTPSEDIAATHGWLAETSWSGDNGATLWVRPQPWAIQRAADASVFVGGAHSDQHASLLADGGQLLVLFTPEPNQHGRLDLAVSGDCMTLSGSYRVTIDGGSEIDSGTVTFRRWSPLRRAEFWLVEWR